MRPPTDGGGRARGEEAASPRGRLVEAVAGPPQWHRSKRGLCRIGARPFADYWGLHLPQPDAGTDPIGSPHDRAAWRPPRTRPGKETVEVARRSEHRACPPGFRCAAGLGLRVADVRRRARRLPPGAPGPWLREPGAGLPQQGRAMGLRLHEPGQDPRLPLRGLAEHVDTADPLVPEHGDTGSQRGRHWPHDSDHQRGGPAGRRIAPQGPIVVRPKPAPGAGILFGGILLRRASVRLWPSSLVPHAAGRHTLMVGGATEETLAPGRFACEQLGEGRLKSALFAAFELCYGPAMAPLTLEDLDQRTAALQRAQGETTESPALGGRQARPHPGCPGRAHASTGAGGDSPRAGRDRAGEGGVAAGESVSRLDNVEGRLDAFPRAIAEMIAASEKRIMAAIAER